MAKLYYYYSAMNAGKSTTLLQSSYNYRERGMDTLLFTAAIDDRFEQNKIHSRIGLEADAISFDEHTNIYNYTLDKIESGMTNLKCLLIDEAQFLKKQQVRQLSDIADSLGIPVLAYGIRTDFRGEPFEGSLYLLAWAEEIIEIKTICHCGRKATMNMRVDASGKTVKHGEQIQIGGNESYIPTCHKHFKAGINITKQDAETSSS